MSHESAREVFPLIADIRAQIQQLSGRILLVGCSVSAIEYLSGPGFDFNVFAIDRDLRDIETCKNKLVHIPGMQQRISFVADNQLPFEDDFFSCVVWSESDRLAAASESDSKEIQAEVQRVLAPAGCAILQLAIDAWATASELLQRWEDSDSNGLPIIERIEIDRPAARIRLWQRSRVVQSPEHRPATEVEVQNHPADSQGLYQQIYDQNPWYGDADQGRCPGVRLLPEYQDWLVGPIIDLGCGRGQVVEKLIAAGFEAEGVDQIVCNPQMRVGDITQPIEGMERFQSTVCIDCIEHLYDEQVIGLFQNMQRTQRQAFSIHNGQSTGTGQELHVNRKDFIDWTKMIREYLDIASAIQINDNQVLYLTRSRS